MTDSESPKSRLPRTGTLLLISVGLLFAVGGVKIWLPYHREQQIIAQIEELGGTSAVTPALPFGLSEAEYLRELKWFNRLGMVNLSETQASDSDLEDYAQLKQLFYLNLISTDVSDAGLKNIKGLTNLKQLWLINTRIGDAGLEHLSGLTKLEELYLYNTQVTESGVKKLQKALPKCIIEWTPPSP